MLSIGTSKCNVACLMNCNRSTIIDLWNRYQQQGHPRDHPCTGRSRVTTANQDRYMRLSHARDRFLSAAESAKQTIGTHIRPINGNTVSRRLAENGLRSRRPYTGQILLPRHRQARLAWANAHSRWPRQRWQTVLFTDQSKFNLKLFRRSTQNVQTNW